jgi:hypothetical protein
MFTDSEAKVNQDILDTQVMFIEIWQILLLCTQSLDHFGENNLKVPFGKYAQEPYPFGSWVFLCLFDK